MCGIVGMVSSFSNGFSHDEANMFQEMLFVDTLRGWDSTGVFGVDKHRNVGITKDAVNGADFIMTEAFKRFRTKLLSNGLFAVGHNRAATRGTVSDKNAHPFWVDDKIILVQNGTYKGSHKHHKDVEVDSEAIAHVLAEEDDIEKALQKVNAAYALVWFNTKTGCLHLIRNEERPLWWAEDHKNGGFYFASEAATISWAAWRNNVTLKDRPRLLEPYTLVTCSITGKYYSYEEKKIDAKYRYTRELNEDTAPFFPDYSQRTYENSSDLSKPPHMTALTHTPVQNSVVQMFKHQPDDVKLKLKDMVPYRRPEMMIKKEHALKVLDVWNDKVKAKGTFTVELEDFWEANNNAECTSWWVFGNLVDPNLPEAKAVICYWLVTNKTREEIINYVCDDFYLVSPSTASATMVRRGEDECAVLTQLCTNVTILKALHE